MLMPSNETSQPASLHDGFLARSAFKNGVCSVDVDIDLSFDGGAIKSMERTVIASDGNMPHPLAGFLDHAEISSNSVSLKTVPSKSRQLAPFHAAKNILIDLRAARYIKCRPGTARFDFSPIVSPTSVPKPAPLEASSRKSAILPAQEMLPP